jgi:hypothetical protein
LKHYYKEALDFAIVDILETKVSPLQYNKLEGQIKSYCPVSSATLSLHLRALVGGKVLQRIVENNGHTFYSLTGEFREALEIQKKHDPTQYLEKTLSLPSFQKKTWHSFHRVKFYTKRPSVTNHQ